MDFIGRPTLMILTLGCGLVLLSESTSADENPRMESTKPMTLKIKEIRVEKVKALTGPD